jgi:LacI family transcriptional regulator, galactose operon repressor
LSSLRKLASTLGLSITTVSRALDGYPEVAAATRQRVIDAARATNYRPHAAARRLRLGSTETVTMVLPGTPGHFDEPLYLELLTALGARFDAAGFDLTVLAARDLGEERAVYRRLVEGRRTDGLIVARTRRNDQRIKYLAQARFPFVAIGRTETRLAYAHVDGDGESAFRAATERLIALGHRRIAFVAAPGEFTFGKLRRRGWAAAMQAAGLAHDAIEGQLTEFGGLAAARELLATAQRPTALLCATDRMAIGALRAAKEAGLTVGRDISIIGHDNISASAFCEPALTTMELSMTAVGARVADMLIALIGGADPRGLAEILPVLAVERASVGPAPELPT